MTSVVLLLAEFYERGLFTMTIYGRHHSEEFVMEKKECAYYQSGNEIGGLFC